MNGIGRLISDDGVITVDATEHNRLLSSTELDDVIAITSVKRQAAAVADERIIAVAALKHGIEPNVEIVDDQIIAIAGEHRHARILDVERISVVGSNDALIIGLD